jgi:DNA-binding transcriptional MerR regulator
MDERMSSGAFAARTRLSRKALRLYEEKGLLRPVAVDPSSGYRSYAVEQVERARLIGLLRRLGMPVARIAAVLDLERVAAAKAVDDWWDGAEVCVPFTGSVEPAGQLSVRLEPAHTEAYARITRGQVRFPEILRAYDAVSSWLQQAGRKPSQPPREVYFVDFSAVADDEPAADIAFPYEVS